MPQVRTLTLAEMKEIYSEYMVKDFPMGELRPFSSVEKNTMDGNYRSFGFFEGDRFLAYACFYTYKGSKEALMDYFAVVPELRGRGVGSAFLRAMISDLPGGYSILIEAESADTAKNEAERKERERRLSFYERNGAVPTGVRCFLFIVDYEILAISPGNDGLSEGSGSEACRSPEDYFEMIKGLYKNLYKTVFGKFCKIYIKK